MMFKDLKFSSSILEQARLYYDDSPDSTQRDVIQAKQIGHYVCVTNCDLKKDSIFSQTDQKHYFAIFICCRFNQFFFQEVSLRELLDGLIYGGSDIVIFLSFVAEM